MFINPWIYYQINDPDKIPDLNPHNKDEERGCLSVACAYILASIIFVILMYFTLQLKLKDYINFNIFMLINLFNVIVYIISVIGFANISFKITDKINNKINNKRHKIKDYETDR